MDVDGRSLRVALQKIANTIAHREVLHIIADPSSRVVLGRPKPKAQNGSCGPVDDFAVNGLRETLYALIGPTVHPIPTVAIRHVDNPQYKIYAAHFELEHRRPLQTSPRQAHVRCLRIYRDLLPVAREYDLSHFNGDTRDDDTDHHSAQDWKTSLSWKIVPWKIVRTRTPQAPSRPAKAVHNSPVVHRHISLHAIVAIVPQAWSH